MTTATSFTAKATQLPGSTYALVRTHACSNNCCKSHSSHMLHAHEKQKLIQGATQACQYLTSFPWDSIFNECMHTCKCAVYHVTLMYHIKGETHRKVGESIEVWCSCKSSRGLDTLWQQAEEVVWCAGARGWQHGLYEWWKRIHLCYCLRFSTGDGIDDHDSRSCRQSIITLMSQAYFLYLHGINKNISQLFQLAWIHATQWCKAPNWCIWTHSTQYDSWDMCHKEYVSETCMQCKGTLQHNLHL